MHNHWIKVIAKNEVFEIKIYQLQKLNDDSQTKILELRENLAEKVNPLRSVQDKLQQSKEIMKTHNKSCEVRPSHQFGLKEYSDKIGLGFQAGTTQKIGPTVFVKESKVEKGECSMPYPK
ncbi:hypothetical protein TorRG33x02_022090, partial [Trema orientale]